MNGHSLGFFFRLRILNYCNCVHNNEQYHRKELHLNISSAGSKLHLCASILHCYKDVTYLSLRVDCNSYLWVHVDLMSFIDSFFFYVVRLS